MQKAENELAEKSKGRKIKRQKMNRPKIKRQKNNDMGDLGRSGQFTLETPMVL